MQPAYHPRLGIVVTARTQEHDLIRQHLVDEPVFIGEAPRPDVGTHVFERLRLADPTKRVASGSFD